MQKRRVPIAFTLLGTLLMLGCSAKRPHTVDTVRAGVDANDYERNPTAAKSAIIVGPNNVNAHMGLAQHYIVAGDFNSATNELLTVTRLEPDNREAAFMLGLSLEHLHRNGDAVKVWEKLAQSQDSWGIAAKKHLVKLGHV